MSFDGFFANEQTLYRFFKVSALIMCVGIFDLFYFFFLASGNINLFRVAVFIISYGALSMVLIAFKVRGRRKAKKELDRYDYLPDHADYSSKSREQRLDILEKRYREGKMDKTLYESIRKRLLDERPKGPDGPEDG